MRHHRGKQGQVVQIFHCRAPRDNHFRVLCYAYSEKSRDDSWAAISAGRDWTEGLIDGSLSIEIAGRYRLDDVERAHEDLEDRRTVGKPLIKIA